MLGRFAIRSYEEGANSPAGRWLERRGGSNIVYRQMEWSMISRPRSRSHAANITAVCGLLATYYTASFVLSGPLGFSPAATYLTLALLFIQVVSLMLGVLVYSRIDWSRSTPALKCLIVSLVLAMTCVIVVQGYYLSVWFRDIADDRLVLSRQLIKQVSLSTHAVFVTLSGIALVRMGDVGLNRTWPARRDYGLLLLVLAPLVTYHASNPEYFDLLTSGEYFMTLVSIPALAQRLGHLMGQQRVRQLA